MAAEIAGIDRLALRRYVDRVVKLHEERKDLNAAIGEVYDEAKEAGIVTKHLRTVVREVMMDREEREAQYHMLASYRSALGMLADTPLGEAAMHAAGDETSKDDGGGTVRTLRGGPGRPRKTPPTENGHHEIGEPLGAA